MRHVGPIDCDVRATQLWPERRVDALDGRTNVGEGHPVGTEVATVHGDLECNLANHTWWRDALECVRRHEPPRRQLFAEAAEDVLERGRSL